MRVPDADREPASFHLGFEIKDTEHLHAVERHGIFFVHHTDVAKAEGFNQRLNDRVMRHWFMG